MKDEDLNPQPAFTRGEAIILEWWSIVCAERNMKSKLACGQFLNLLGVNLHRTCCPSPFGCKGSSVFSPWLPCPVPVSGAAGSVCFWLFSPIDGGHFEFGNCSPGICLPCLFLFPGTDFWFVNLPSSSCEIADDVQEVQCLQTICHCFLAEKLSLPVS